MALTVFEYPDGELVVDSRLVAARLNIQHESFMKTLRKYESRIVQRFGQFRFEIGTVVNSVGAVNETDYVLLTEPQASALMTLSRNTDQVVECKLELVEAFEKAKQIIHRFHQSSAVSNIGLDHQIAAWQQRYDLRIYLKDVLRPSLMDATKAWAQAHGVSPITLCSAVHDEMNKGIQGLKAEEIHVRNGISANDLLRDYYGPRPLMDYSSINQVACNLILDKGFEPIAAVVEACSVYFPSSRIPLPVPVEENLYLQGARLKRSQRRHRLQQGIQLNMFEQLEQAS